MLDEFCDSLWSIFWPIFDLRLSAESESELTLPFALLLEQFRSLRSRLSHIYRLEPGGSMILFLFIKLMGLSSFSPSGLKSCLPILCELDLAFAKDISRIL